MSSKEAVAVQGSRKWEALTLPPRGSGLRRPATRSPPECRARGSSTQLLARTASLIAGQPSGWVPSDDNEQLRLVGKAAQIVAVPTPTALK